MGFTAQKKANGQINLSAAIEQLLLITSCYQNDRDSIEEELVALGGGSILDLFFNPDTWPPSFVVVRSGNDICIAITGTTSWPEALGDVLGCIGQRYEGGSEIVHGFFYLAWVAMRNRVKALMPPDVGNCRIMFTGHSYGGCVALLGSIEFKRLNIGATREFLGFGCAKLFGLGFVGPLPELASSLRVDGDIIPYLPMPFMGPTAGDPVGAILLGRNFTWAHPEEQFDLYERYGTIPHVVQQGGDGALPFAQIYGSTYNDHKTANYAAILTSAWRQSENNGTGRMLVPILNHVVEETPRQNVVGLIPPAQIVDIPFQNVQIFSSTPTTPLTPANVSLVTSVGAAFSVATEGSGILRNALEDGNMADSKITFFFRTNVQGFSESYIIPGQDPQSVLVADLVTYVQRRMAICGPQTTWEYVRISSVGNPRLVQIYYPGAPFPNAPVSGNPFYNVSGSNDPDTALIVRRTNAAQFSLQYLRGIPDGVTSYGGIYTPFGPFAADLASFFAHMTNTLKWAWRSNNKALTVSSLIANAFINGADGTGAFTLATPLFPLNLVGKRVAVRISRVNTPRSLNGPLTVTVKDPSTAVTLNQLALSSFAPNVGRMTYTPSTNTVIAQMKVEKAGERKAGRPFGVARGRLPNRGVR